MVLRLRNEALRLAVLPQVGCRMALSSRLPKHLRQNPDWHYRPDLMRRPPHE